MTVGVLSVSIEIHGAFSLKDKRRVLHRIRDRLRARLNVAVAEVGANEAWNHAEIAVVTVANEQPRANEVLSAALKQIECLRDFNLAEVNTEFIRA